jgi:hypothetical protein
MAEVVLDVQDSIFEFELKCEFDVLNPSMQELLEQEIDKFKEAYPELYARLEKELNKLEDTKSG